MTQDWFADYHHLQLVRVLLFLLVFGVLGVATLVVSASRSRRLRRLFWRPDPNGHRVRDDRLRQHVPWHGPAE